MPVFNNALAGAAGSGGAAAGYTIKRSLRFHSSDDTRLDNNMSSGANRGKFTFSFWAKFAKSDYAILSCGSSSPGFFELKFNSDSKLEIHGENITNTQTVAQFRDPSAWYHVMLVIDKANSTATDRAIFYVNGNRQTLSTTSQANTSNVYWGHQNQPHRIGGRTFSGGNEANFYLADFHYLDGIAATPSDFGETDVNGVWQPIQYSGTYGTKGTHLDFSNNSSTGSLGIDANVEGTRYSTDCSGALANNYSFATLFDGNVNTLCLGANDATLTFTPATPIAWTDAAGGVEIYYHNSSQQDKARINGGSWVNASNTGGWEKVSTGDGTLTKLEIRDQSTNEAAIYAIRINGTILTDPSGANDWTSNNFSLATTTVTHWRQATSSDNPSSGSQGSINYRSFRALTDPATSSLVWDHQNTQIMGLQNITGVTELRLLISSRGSAHLGLSGGAMFSIGSVGGDYSNAQSQAAWYTVSNPPSSLTSIAATGGGSGTGNFCSVWGIEVNGVRVVDRAATDNDSVLDSPTDYETDAGVVGGNFCTWNPLDKANELDLSNGNLWVSETSGQQLCTRGTQWLSSGQWYWEVTVAGNSVHNGGQISIGVATGEQSFIAQPGAGGAKGSVVYWPSGTIYQNGVSKGGATAYNYPGATIGVALDMDAKTIAFYLDGTLQSISCTGLEGEVAPLVHLYAPDDAVTLKTNFGQQPYRFTNAGTDRPAATYKAVCTKNRTPSTIPNGNNHVVTRTFSGTGNTQLIPSDFEPDFIWNERRNGGAAAVLSYGLNKFSTYLQLPATDQEYPASGMVPGSTGLTISGTGAGLNATNSTYVMRMFNGGDPINTFNTNAYDQSESWSLITTKSGGGTAAGKALERGFDGTTSTSTEGDSNNEYVEIPISATISAGGVRVYAAVTSANPLVINLYNGSSNVETVSGSNSGGQWYATSTYSGAITKIRIERTGRPFEFNAVEVNGKILTNAGLVTAGSLNDTVYNTDSNWSVSGSNMQYDWNTSFDGKDSPTFALPNTGYSASMTFATPINYTTLELVVSRDIYAPDLLMNGNALNVPATDTNTTGGQYVKERFRFYNGTLSSIGHNTRNTAGRGGSGFWYIIVDGKILVDTNQASSAPAAPGIPTTTTVNNDAGISISRFTGTGSGSSFATGLNKPADFVILKGTSFSDDYRVYHRSLDDAEPEDYYLILQSTAAKSADQQGSFMNDRAPNSGIVHLGTDSAVNGSDREMIALSFAEIPGFSKFGKYSGSQYHVGSGPFVWCGFAPELIIAKVFAGSQDPFMIWDNARRNNRNPIRTQMKLSEGGYESAEYADFSFDFTSNGFYVSGASGQVNAQNSDFVFMAFAKTPFELARAL
jgi:hypothetical protein